VSSERDPHVRQLTRPPQFTARSSPTRRCSRARRFPLLYPTGPFFLASCDSRWDALDNPVRQAIISSMTAHAAIPQEIEAKLLVPRPTILSAIARLKDLGPYRLRPQQTVRLHTIYLDTAEFTLARHGVALRLRRNRTRWEASIKWSGREDGIVHCFKVFKKAPPFGRGNLLSLLGCSPPNSPL
jgi:hypothetical protein